MCGAASDRLGGAWLVELASDLGEDLAWQAGLDGSARSLVLQREDNERRVRKNGKVFWEFRR
jgi:hypothetical protein